MIPNRINFQIAFSSPPIPTADVWQTLCVGLSRFDSLPKKFKLSQLVGHADGEKSEKRLELTPHEISSLMEDRKLSGFSVNTGYTEKSVQYLFQCINDGDLHALLSSEIGLKANAPEDWSYLIEAIINQWNCIGGWQWNGLYYSWQNSKSISVYRRHFGEVPTNFRSRVSDMMSNDQPQIDVSSNPGRSHEIFKGIFFKPTAEMWLGDKFWNFSKCTKEDALAADFFIEKRDTPHFLYLKSWPHAFTRPDGEQGRMQQRLWKLLFHEDCEWPPGSGTICDEPIYGPPELMPDQP